MKTKTTITLELSSEEKRERHAKLEERLGGVRNLREEAAVMVEDICNHTQM